MATSNTYNYAPSLGDLTANAFARLQIRRTELTQQHLFDAATEANLVNVEFSNKQPLLWRRELYTTALVAGTATYTLPSRLIAFSAVYISSNDGAGSVVDRILGPLSTYEYASQPNKDTQGYPTSYWYDRTSIPQITLWPVPDNTTTYTLKIQCYTQIQDAVLPSGVTPDLPYRFLDAYVAALAHRMARIYKPDLEERRELDAIKAWDIAANQDTEQVPMFVLPGLSSYYP